MQLKREQPIAALMIVVDDHLKLLAEEAGPRRELLPRNPVLRDFRDDEAFRHATGVTGSARNSQVPFQRCRSASHSASRNTITPDFANVCAGDIAVKTRQW